VVKEDDPSSVHVSAPGPCAKDHVAMQNIQPTAKAVRQNEFLITLPSQIEVRFAKKEELAELPGNMILFLHLL
jgi:hypothetical protein